MDYKAFYSALYAPLIQVLGPEDRNTIVAIIGFDAGGPLNFCTFGRDAKKEVVTYVSCELAVRPEQKPSSFGRYELLASCNDEDWVRSVLSDTGRMSMDSVFSDGDTMDIGGWVNGGFFTKKPPIQGLLFVKEAEVKIEGNPFGIMRCIGITRPEMKFAQKHGSAQLISRLKQAGVFPHTNTGRKSVI